MDNKPFLLIKLEHRYLCDKGNDMNLWNLGSFLTELDSYIAHFEDFVFDENQNETGGNRIDLVKQGNCIVIYDTTSQKPDKGPFLYVKIDNYIELLQQWKAFCTTKPTEILITYDANNRIIMTPTFEKSQ